MMDITANKELTNQLNEAIWVTRILFNRGKATGTSANISFRYEDSIYISGSGTCFGMLSPEKFAAVRCAEIEKYNYSMGSLPSDSSVKPSKELPIHYLLYKKSPEIRAVVHTHSFYSTLISCLEHDNEQDIIPSYTPYLKMKVGRIGLVPYAQPGSKELYKYMEKRIYSSDGFILQNHGPIIAGKSLMDAFAGLEELEESAKIAWHLRGKDIKHIEEK